MRKRFLAQMVSLLTNLYVDQGRLLLGCAHTVNDVKQNGVALHTQVLTLITATLRCLKNPPISSTVLLLHCRPWFRLPPLLLSTCNGSCKVHICDPDIDVNLPIEFKCTLVAFRCEHGLRTRREALCLLVCETTKKRLDGRCVNATLISPSEAQPVRQPTEGSLNQDAETLRFQLDSLNRPSDREFIEHTESRTVLSSPINQFRGFMLKMSFHTLKTSCCSWDVMRRKCISDSVQTRHSQGEHNVAETLTRVALLNS